MQRAEHKALERMIRSRDALAAARRRMPWLAVEKEYVFDGPQGNVSLPDLFEGRFAYISRATSARMHMLRLPLQIALTYATLASRPYEKVLPKGQPGRHACSRNSGGTSFP